MRKLWKIKRYMLLKCLLEHALLKDAWDALPAAQRTEAHMPSEVSF